MLHMGPDASFAGFLQRSLPAWVALTQKVNDTGVLENKLRCYKRSSSLTFRYRRALMFSLKTRHESTEKCSKRRLRYIKAADTRLAHQDQERYVRTPNSLRVQSVMLRRAQRSVRGSEPDTPSSEHKRM